MAIGSYSLSTAQSASHGLGVSLCSEGGLLAHAAREGNPDTPPDAERGLRRSNHSKPGKVTVDPFAEKGSSLESSPCSSAHAQKTSDPNAAAAAQRILPRQEEHSPKSSSAPPHTALRRYGTVRAAGATLARPTPPSLPQLRSSRPGSGSSFGRSGSFGSAGSFGNANSSGSVNRLARSHCAATLEALQAAGEYTSCFAL